jgi:hypothetical protein
MGQQKHFTVMNLANLSTIKPNAIKSRMIMLKIETCLAIV